MTLSSVESVPIPADILTSHWMFDFVWCASWKQVLMVCLIGDEDDFCNHDESTSIWYVVIFFSSFVEIIVTYNPHGSNRRNDHQPNISNSVCIPLSFPMFRMFLIKALQPPQYTAHHRAMSALPASSPRHALSNGFDAKVSFPSPSNILTSQFRELSCELLFSKLLRRAVNSFCEWNCDL